MYIFFEYAACVILVAVFATLLLAVFALTIVVRGVSRILGRLGRGGVRYMRILLAHQKAVIRSGLCSAGLSLNLDRHEELAFQGGFHVPDGERGLKATPGS